MYKTLRIAAMLFVAVMCMPQDLSAQTVSQKTVEQYRQMVTICNGAKRPAFVACTKQLESYGFVYNKAEIIDMFTMRMHPFLRAEGQDTVGCTLVTLNDTVYTVSGTFISMEPARTFALVNKASDIQAKLAAKYGCTKYVGSVKGKVKKATYDRNELLAALKEADADMVSMVYEQWKSEDGTREFTCIYKNDRYGKKKPKSKDRAILTLSAANSTK